VYDGDSCYWTGSRNACYPVHKTKPDFGLFAGPEVSVASLRFGAKRQFELELLQGIVVPVTHSLDVGFDKLIFFYNTLSFQMLFL
jgi:hypothetical protein